MSVILDALRKLDREKASGRSGAANIAAEILRPDLPRPERRTARYIAIVFLASIATAAVTYSVIVRGGFVTKSPPPLAPNFPAPGQQVAPVPLSDEPVRHAGDEISPAPRKIQSPVKSKKPPASLGKSVSDEKKRGQNVSVKEADVATEKAKLPAEYQPSASATPAPLLNISAIVWYEERSKRFAMINGLIATEGSFVEGMKVEEIYPNRVRFLHNGQPLEISIK